MHESKKDLNDYKDCRLDRALPDHFDVSREDTAHKVTASEYIHEIRCHGELPPELYDDVQALVCSYAFSPLFDTAKMSSLTITQSAGISITITSTER